MEVKNIFSLKLCGYLCICGFPVKGVRPNAKYPNKSVYVFENTDRLNECIKSYNKEKNYCSKEKKNDLVENSKSSSKLC